MSDTDDTLPIRSAILLASAAPSAASRLYDALFDNTFAGIHHLEFFDWAMLVPYFSVLAVLIRGTDGHRYALIRAVI